jgi:hypothetical protein
VTNYVSSDVRQHATHEELVGRDDSPVPSQARTIDAIIVPASRPAANLDHAVTLARAARSHLVVLCSREAHANAVHELLAARSFTRASVIKVPTGYHHKLLKFDTSRIADLDLPKACATRDSDLSAKRNIGLLLARMLRWERVFFMDDDIRDVDSSDLHRTVAMLGSYNTVGMRVSSFPDNSVVCHAHRETGAFQDVSVSGSALAVACAAPIGFFPDIYNEDWLFFYQDIEARQLGSSGLNATQLRYDPFKDPRRAAGQEFGDVLAEGLYALLHQGAGAAQATQDYWVEFLDARRIFLEAIIDRSAKLQGQLKQKIFNSVSAAQKSLTEIQPELCERYVMLWLKDRHRWLQRLEHIRRMPSIEEALRRLNLSPANSIHAQWTRQVHADVPLTGPPGPAPIPAVATVNGQPEESAPPRESSAAASSSAARLTAVSRASTFVAGRSTLALALLPQLRQRQQRRSRDNVSS